MVYVEDTFTNKISIWFLSNDTNLILFMNEIQHITFI